MRYLTILLKLIRSFESRIWVRVCNVVWKYTNIYPTARIGIGNSIGSYTEIGHDVIIGDYNRIGAHCFIPSLVIIKDNCFIGPFVCFTNDKFPPSGEGNWSTTIIDNNVSIGAGSIILPGVTIGHDALVGAGSVVTKPIPPGEIVCGNPAKPISKQAKSRIVWHKKKS